MPFKIYFIFYPSIQIYWPWLRMKTISICRRDTFVDQREKKTTKIHNSSFMKHGYVIISCIKVMLHLSRLFVNLSNQKGSCKLWFQMLQAGLFFYFPIEDRSRITFFLSRLNANLITSYGRQGGALWNGSALWNGRARLSCVQCI